MIRYAVVLMFVSMLSLCLAQAEIYPDVGASSKGEATANSKQSQDHRFNLAMRDSNYTKERIRSGQYQADRYVDREHRSEFARPYMYVNPAFPEFYSNFYDNDNTKFYFYYQNDNSNSYNESPSNYNNDTDYSWGENDSSTESPTSNSE